MRFEGPLNMRIWRLNVQQFVLKRAFLALVKHGPLSCLKFNILDGFDKNFWISVSIKVAVKSARKLLTNELQCCRTHARLLHMRQSSFSIARTEDEARSDLNSAKTETTKLILLLKHSKPRLISKSSRYLKTPDLVEKKFSSNLRHHLTFPNEGARETCFPHFSHLDDQVPPHT